MSESVSWMEAARWFESLSGIEMEMARFCMLIAQRDYGLTFDKALCITCESYRRSKAKEDQSVDMSDEAAEKLRQLLNGKKGN